MVMNLVSQRLTQPVSKASMVSRNLVTRSAAGVPRSSRVFAPREPIQPKPLQTPAVNRALSVSGLATPYGCCNFFDICTDELMSLHYRGRLGLLDWMGFDVTDVCHRSVEFITYNRPQMVGGRATSGSIADPCDDPYGVEYGTAKITVDDFGRYGRTGPTRPIMQPTRYCVSSPRIRLDGQVVTSEREWDTRFATDVMLDDIRRDLIIGNATTPGQFDGLQRWVRTGFGYGGMLDSIVIDFNGNSMAGGAGITWNGNAVAATFNFVDILLAAFRRIRRRIGWSPVLSTIPPAVGDMILVLPSFMINCLLDFYTCWSVCPGQLYNEANINTLEARTFRNSLNGGLYGDGQITLDGMTIPLMAYDWGLINGPTTGDIFFLTGSIGGVRVFSGEHLDANIAAQEYAAAGYSSLDGGRILSSVEVENECRQLKVWMHPRLFCMAPWAQIRFQDVQCAWPGGPLSPDPLETSYYPLSSFTSAHCD